MTAPDNACPVEQVRDAAEQALELLEHFDNDDSDFGKSCDYVEQLLRTALARQRTLPPVAEVIERVAKFQLGDEVEKIKGSSWRGRIVGTYSTSLTPEGYCVESSREPGSVQLYPAAALTNLQTGGDGLNERVES